jgi:outer membrane protein OmpA-like peptidoglycan-associated protein
MSVKTAGRWSPPINLGNAINTPGNEMFPTFIGKDVLTFASDARIGGYGSLDIWYTRFPRGEIKNAGNKINTHLDDFGLVIHKSGKTGYFASDRGGVGSDDIYRLDIHPRMYVFNGKVVNDMTGLPIENAGVVLTNCEGQQVSTTTSDAKGMFQFNVLAGSCPQVEASRMGYSRDRKEVAGLDFVELRLRPENRHEVLVLDVDTKQPVPGASIGAPGKTPVIGSALGLIVLNQPFTQGEKLIVTARDYLDQSLNTDLSKLKGAVLRDTIYLFKKELNKTFVLDNIYYNYDKWDILPASKLELNKLVKIMNDNPGIKVELGSHTDARGSDSYNLQLSQKRSDSAVAYIISSGIAKNRILAKGYGETKLVNHCKNGVKCPDDVHRQNRRTEFKLIGL